MGQSDSARIWAKCDTGKNRATRMPFRGAARDSQAVRPLPAGRIFRTGSTLLRMNRYELRHIVEGNNRG